MNNRYLLSKRYISNALSLLSPLKEKKDFSLLKKKLFKYEDISYFKDAYDDKYVEILFTKYQSSEVNDEVVEQLNNFYDNFFLNKEILDLKGIKIELKKIATGLDAINDNFYLSDIAPLYEFENNINAELNVYISKHKTDEYMDMSILHKNVKRLIEDLSIAIETIISDHQLDYDTFKKRYLEFICIQFGVYFDNKKAKDFSVPTWGKGLLFCLPWIIGFLAFTLYPLIQTIIFSFSRVNLTPEGFQTTFIGFTNYINVFTSDTDFILALKNYLISMVIYVPLITIFSLILAMLLNSKIKTKSLFRTIFFFPVIITSGPVIKILIEQGVTAMPGINKIADVNSLTASMPEFVRIGFNIVTSEFVLILWFSGIQILVFLTALQKIDKGVYEASAIDGASKWEQFWKVTLPALNPTIVINVIFTVVMQSIFALNPIILKIQNDMNDTSEGKGYGYSSALAFVYFFIMIIVLILFVLIFKKHEKKVRRAK